MNPWIVLLLSVAVGLTVGAMLYAVLRDHQRAARADKWMKILDRENTAAIEQMNADFNRAEAAKRRGRR